MAEVALFRPDDPHELVAASFACRMCLSGHVELDLRSEDYDPVAVCTCRECGDVRPVYLSSAQALRLALISCRL
jgi:hypothetical protein